MMCVMCVKLVYTSRWYAAVDPCAQMSARKHTQHSKEAERGSELTKKATFDTDGALTADSLTGRGHMGAPKHKGNESISFWQKNKHIILHLTYRVRWIQTGWVKCLLAHHRWHCWTVHRGDEAQNRRKREEQEVRLEEETNPSCLFSHHPLSPHDCQSCHCVERLV